MTGEKRERTFFLDGLVEGPTPRNAEGREHVEEWIRTARSVQIHLSLEIDGGHLSLLGDDTPRPVNDLEAPVEDRVKDLLAQLPRAWVDEPPPQLFSTLRSVEYRKNEEIQTLYGFQPDGSVHAESRSVPARTTAPPEPMDLRQTLRLAGVGLLIAAILFGLAMLIPGVRESLWRIASRAGPVSSDAIAVDTGPFAPYLEVTKKTVRNLGDDLELRIAPTKAWGDLLARHHRERRGGGERVAEMTLREVMVASALVRGYVRCELLDARGRCIGYTEMRLGELVRPKEKDKDAPGADAAAKTGDSTEADSRPVFVVRIPLPRRHRTHRIVLLP